ncbi:SUMF1/EgtB/PvdO family nonheme iron enzyme [Pseudanabaena sp. FACHB-1998]|uniref:caspase, EACC1-associated type n=1 Tax=Pseudanabaena sp. FACHB-1998 TaxID=2692858 RepID=UPI001681AA68|nr:SUMF1/EgtB/PvdO family nonheme iron enzyme [Pseudanabaena sp. FACHB-1998]MBD2175755.1 SUMF1/EgtB/PvdO family nonheme iron enzyme [Pseudanabaena sp. FACHB-1998]
MGRYALLVGVSNYITDLNPLPSAVKDVAALKEILIDPTIGGFAASDVEVLTDVDETAIRRGISRLFANRKNDDLVLLYFSGHGVTDSRNDFYLSGISTDKNDLLSTAVSSDFVQKAMNQRGSKRQVLILDCCHSGAFPKGMTAKDIGKVNLSPKLGGEGRAILTASDSTQYAFEQEGFELSLYTHFLVEGLRTGAADRDDDGDVTVDELYEYVRDKVKSVNDLMSPEFYPVKEGHRIVLAKAVQDDPKLKFRKEVENVVRDSNGKISTFAKRGLGIHSQDLGLSQLESESIINEVIRPYEEYDKKLTQYEQDLLSEVSQGFPFSKYVESQLEYYEKRLGLRDADLQEIKSRIIGNKQVEYEQRLQQEQRQAEAVRLKRQQEDAERLRLQQVAEAERQKQESDRLERLRTQAEEEDRLKRLQEEAERVKKQQQSKPAQPEFEFEVVKVRLVKESGFLGIGGGTKIELDRKNGKAQYIRENLGNGVTLDLVKIPAGKFMMGMPADERKIALENAKKYDWNGAEAYLDRSTPQHEVKVPSFLMGKYTVTNAQWQAVMGTKPSESSDVKFQGENQPVINVSWDNCREFCKKLSEKINKNVRLPSEAEWEYACRAGTTTAFHFGETITTELVNYDGNYPYVDAPKGEYRQKTVDVNFDRFSPNAWGLYQMHGNVWEWCEDVWHENYNGAPTDGSAWLTGGEQNRRALRGGSWFCDAINCRSAFRIRNPADYSDDFIGFRVVVA